MHPLIFVAIALVFLGTASYGVSLMPLESQPKQFCHFGLVIAFLAVVSRHFGLM